jgi:hypothetical protein
LPSRPSPRFTTASSRSSRRRSVRLAAETAHGQGIGRLPMLAFVTARMRHARRATCETLFLELRSAPTILVTNSIGRDDSVGADSPYGAATPRSRPNELAAPATSQAAGDMACTIQYDCPSGRTLLPGGFLRVKAGAVMEALIVMHGNGRALSQTVVDRRFTNTAGLP